MEEPVLMSHEPGKKVTILDCTLRDGGYFNYWQFNKKIAQDTVQSLIHAGVDIIEIGYKTPGIKKEKHFEGLFRYCTESQLRFLDKYPRAQYAFMIDTKEFLTDNKPDQKLISRCIPPAAESLFDWVRIATYFPNLGASTEIAQVLKDNGYNVTLNLMGASLLSDDDANSALAVLRHIDVDVFYFSDSFGDLDPSDVRNWIGRIRQHFKGKIGIHTHDNNGLAFANTIVALTEGIDFLDATVMGMGRGAGNLKTEQILLYLYFRLGYRHLNPSALLDLINHSYSRLKEKYQWGWDYTYMLSSLQNIHPTYCQNLRATNQYTIGQVSKILNSIEISQRSKFNETSMIKAIDSAINEPIDSENNLVDIPLYKPIRGNEFLIIATGPSVPEFEEEISEFIRQRDPVVIECNPAHDHFESVSEKYYRAILNWVRLKTTLESIPVSPSPIITGLGGLPRDYLGRATIVRYPLHVGRDQVVIRTDGLVVPAYDVGMFAVGLTMLSHPETMYLAGFDGFEPASPKQEKMNLFWDKLDATGVRMVSLTPTTYPLDIEPVYRFIH